MHKKRKGNGNELSMRRNMRTGRKAKKEKAAYLSREAVCDTKSPASAVKRVEEPNGMGC